MQCGVELCGIGARNEENGQEIEEKHQAKIRFGLTIGTVKFLPGQHTPECSDHWRRLSDGVGNGDARKPCCNEIEDRAESPDASTQDSEDMTLHRSAKKISEVNGLADQRLLHEINIPDETGEQRSQRQEDRNAVGAKRVPARHS